MLGRIALYGTLLLSSIALVLIVFTIEYGRMVREGLPASVSLETLSTDTWAIFDPNTGRIYDGKHVDTVRPIASITKLFTAYAVMESDAKDSGLPIQWKDLEAEGRSKLVAGDTMTPYELLFPLLIESSNDAGEAIDRMLGEDATRSVSALTSELSLTHTSLHDATGLSADNVSTISELVSFYSHLKRAHPHVLDISRLRMYITEDTGYVNNNPARNIPTFTGGKNGYTLEAGRTFIGTFERDGAEIGIVLLGSSDITADIEQILAFAAPAIMRK